MRVYHLIGLCLSICSLSIYPSESLADTYTCSDSVSILIEIIEKLQDVDGKLGYYNLAPIVEKTFNIMGLTKYSTVFQSEEEALAGMS